MKILKHLAMAFIFMSSFATANNYLGEPAKKANAPTRVSPGNLPFQKVNVCFVVNENGNVTEVNVKTNNKQIKQQVQKQMMGLYIKGLEACIVNCTDVFVGS